MGLEAFASCNYTCDHLKIKQRGTGTLMLLGYLLDRNKLGLCPTAMQLLHVPTLHRIVKGILNFFV